MSFIIRFELDHIGRPNLTVDFKTDNEFDLFTLIAQAYRAGVNLHDKN